MPEETIEDRLAALEQFKAKAEATPDPSAEIADLLKQVNDLTALLDKHGIRAETSS